ncbi:condensation domain-containing protein, partial [Streptomyces sp. 5-6(2022)]|uniref:condensation domain-containing protein n=1 Tax=Streptomyces sp. 5-6(2022) TaxID=2936510 RepID=UPI0023BA1D8B
MLAVQNTPEVVVELPGLQAAPADVGEVPAKFDLDIQIQEHFDEAGRPAGLNGGIVYATDLFDAATAERLAQQLVRTLEAVATDPALPVRQIDLLDPELRHTVLRTWNDTARGVPEVTLP